jgi:multiple sugar transport system substrate-binding protein
MAAEDGRWPTEVGPWQHWVYAAGAGVLDQAMTRCVLDTPQGLTAFQTMTDFVHRDQIAPKPPDVAGKTNAQLFMDGRLAVIIMNRQGSSVEGFVRPHVTIAPLPRGPAGRFSQSPFDGFGLASTTPEPVASWEVLKFRTGDALRRLLHGRGLGGIPALKATAASPEYLNERLPPVWNQFFVDNMATVRLAPPTPAWPDVETTISQTVQQLLRGEVAPPAALRDLAPRVTALLAGG